MAVSTLVVRYTGKVYRRPVMAVINLVVKYSFVFYGIKYL